jgi:hypothetical protein
MGICHLPLWLEQLVQCSFGSIVVEVLGLAIEELVLAIVEELVAIVVVEVLAIVVLVLSIVEQQVGSSG